MRACQSELRRSVIEGRRLPHGRRMTCLAIVAESCCDVVRIRWSSEVHRVTRITVGVRQLIVAIDVTCLTRSCSMSPRQSEFRRTVIERRRLPHVRRMARLAIVAESACGMVRIRRFREVRGVTRVAIGIH